MTAHLILVTDRGRRVDGATSDPSAGDETTARARTVRTAPVRLRGSVRVSARRVRDADHPAELREKPSGSGPRGSSTARVRRAVLRGDRGAVTAEYAVVILAGVAFAGLLVAILRSDEIRQMLVDLVQQALGSAG